MPKKTRREKILAAYRNKTKLFSPSTSVNTGKSIQKPVSQEEEITARYFLTDFKRSLLLVIGIIALEIVLYFATINKYLKF